MTSLISQMSGFHDLLTGEGGDTEVTRRRLRPTVMPVIPTSQPPSYAELLNRMGSPSATGGPHAESDPSATLFMTGE